MNKQSRVVETEEFRLVDAQGNLRARLGPKPDGSISLDFLNKARKVRLQIETDADGSPSVSLADENGFSCFDLVVTSDSKILLTMGRLGPEMAKAALAVTPDGATSLRLSNANGKQRVLPVSSAEGPFLTLIDESGEPKAWIRIDANGAAEFKLRDELGLPAFEVPESSGKTGTM